MSWYGCDGIFPSKIRYLSYVILIHLNILLTILCLCNRKCLVRVGILFGCKRSSNRISTDETCTHSWVHRIKNPFIYKRLVFTSSVIYLARLAREFQRLKSGLNRIQILFRYLTCILFSLNSVEYLRSMPRFSKFCSLPNTCLLFPCA